MHTEATKSICKSKLIRCNYNKSRSQLDKKSELLNVFFIFYFCIMYMEELKHSFPKTYSDITKQYKTLCLMTKFIRKGIVILEASQCTVHKQAVEVGYTWLCL